MLNKLRSKASFYRPIVKLLLKQPRYIKYIFSWEKSPLDLEVPWLGFDVKNWLDKNLNKEMVVFEYGSGGSTLYYAKKVKKIISVEHDKYWYEVVKNKLAAGGLDNSEFHLCHPEPIMNNEPNLYSSTDENYQGMTFEKYVEKINAYPDNYFDLVVVDGRARTSCLKQVLSKVKDGGYVLLDNSERSEYNLGIRLFDKFVVKIFFGPGFSNNTPCEARIWQINK